VRDLVLLQRLAYPSERRSQTLHEHLPRARVALHGTGLLCSGRLPHGDPSDPRHPRNERTASRTSCRRLCSPSRACPRRSSC
jgi:hypothetical protein